LNKILAPPLAPCVANLQATYKVIRYLKQIPGQDLIFKSDSKLELSRFSDADWASCPDSRRFFSFDF
ncbi:unnamed protein product, partial [Linum tenue]